MREARLAEHGVKLPGLSARADAEAVDKIQDAGVAVIGCFITGADGETRASLDRLAKFLETASFADVQITLNTPFPSTALHSRLERARRLLTDRGWSHHTLFDVTYQPDKMSVAELEHAYRQLLVEVFSATQSQRRSAIRRSVWRRNPVLKGNAWTPPNQ